mgnify:CR=1 FL=1
MRDVYAHIEEHLEFLERVPQAIPRYTIVPKKFIVEKVSNEGKGYINFEEGEERIFYGWLETERHMIAGRVFFFPYSVQPGSNSGEARFIEIKGYGQDGKEMCLWSHDDGDILNGMFYKNAKKEFDILEKAYENHLIVPIPLFVGKISRKEWLGSGLRTVNDVLEGRSVKPLDINNLLKVELDTLRKEIEKRTKKVSYFCIDDVLSAFSQPGNAGVLGRATISPFRMGDAS